MFGDTPGQRERVKVHQPKRAVPESAEDQTLEAPATAHGVQWGAAAAEGPDGAAEQPQLVSLISFSKVFKILPLLVELSMLVVLVVSMVSI